MGKIVKQTGGGRDLGASELAGASGGLKRKEPGKAGPGSWIKQQAGLRFTQARSGFDHSQQREPPSAKPQGDRQSQRPYRHHGYTSQKPSRQSPKDRSCSTEQ